MPKYNLALIPTSKSDEVINLANQFSSLADKYLLGKNSLPHVTLYQFETDEGLIEDIWKQVNEVWKDKNISLEFKEFSCIFDGVIFWASLLPNKTDKLHAIHELAAKILGKPIKKSFDPHMTLFNTTSKDYEKEIDAIKGAYKSISDTFVLSLGNCDEIGQFTKIIFKQD